MLSSLAGHYNWSHDFWRRMGLREFNAWVDQLHYELERKARHNDGWDATHNDPRWQEMRAKREAARGR